MTTATDPSIREQLRLWLGVGAPAETPEPVAPLGVGSDRQVVWSRTLGSVWPLALAAVMLAFGVVMLFFAIPTGVILIATSFVVLAFARITVVASRSGLRVRFGVLPWPSKHVALENIEAAAVIELLPIEWGGWGYRISAPAKGFKRTAVVLRKGEAIHLTLKNGREFAVTVDGAEEAAALINAFVRA